MKNIIIFLLALSVCFLLTGCAKEESAASVQTTAAPSAEETGSAETPLTEASIEAPADNDTLQAITDKVGMPFRLYCGTNTDVTVFHILEDSVWRMFDSKTEPGTKHENLQWEINGMELTIIGDWEERFTLDLNAFTATSEKTGKVYRICEEQKFD